MEAMEAVRRSSTERGGRAGPDGVVPEGAGDELVGVAVELRPLPVLTPSFAMVRDNAVDATNRAWGVSPLHHIRLPGASADVGVGSAASAAGG